MLVSATLILDHTQPEERAYSGFGAIIQFLRHVVIECILLIQKRSGYGYGFVYGDLGKERWQKDGRINTIWFVCTQHSQASLERAAQTNNHKTVYYVPIEAGQQC